MLTTSEDGLSV